MHMPPYPVICYAPSCAEAAHFKIAARWSDGATHELKTYSLACRECLPYLFGAALARRASCQLAVGEELDQPGIFDLHRGERDKSLMQREDLEHEVLLARPS